MQQNFEKIKCIVPETNNDLFDYCSKILTTKTFCPFSDEIISFFNILSAKLLNNTEAKKYPDVITFAFWCRKASLLTMKSAYKDDDLLRIGRGVIFHITPSNVPVNFAYSLAVGLLSGNINMVRIPSKYYPQVAIICKVITEIINSDDFSYMKNYILLFSYEKDDEINQCFSQIADIRIIWGGDNAIKNIRKATIPSRSYDITFADRYSMCVINADEFVNEKNIVKVASDFYNDTFLFDQNACTAPHLIIWLGDTDNIRKSKKLFWSELHKIVKEKYGFQPVVAVDKFTSLCEFAIDKGEAKIEHMEDNLIHRINLQKLSNDIDDYRCHSGYFFEYEAEALKEIINIVNRKYQTIAYYGISREVIRDFILKFRPSGIDRFVPIGKTTDFNLIWDGHDLIRSLTRVINY